MDEPHSKRPRITLRKNDNTPTPPPAPKRSEGITLSERGQNGSKASSKREQAPAAPEAAVTHQASTVKFDVCGTTFKVPSKLITSRPETLLAELVESHRRAEDKGAIFVDSDVGRFPLILDWYRYDEIYAPPNVSIDALLLDAAHMQLPEEIFVNGVLRSTVKSEAHEVAADLVATVIENWRGFPRFLSAMSEKVKNHYKNVGAKSAAGTAEDEAYDFLQYRLQLYNEEKGSWADPTNVCSAARARVLAMKLEERGYICGFSDIELTVSLPLKLRGELPQAGGEDEEDNLGEDVVAS